MRDIVGCFMSIVIGALLSFTLFGTLKAYNNHERLLAVVEEKEILQRVTSSPLTKIEGDRLTFRNGIIDVKNNSYKTNNDNIKFKTLRLTLKPIKSVKIDTKTSVNKNEFEANRLYAIKYTFKVNKKQYDRTEIVYCTDERKVR